MPEAIPADPLDEIDLDLDPEPDPPGHPVPLRPYQIADLSFLIGQKRALLLHDPGGGKTPPVCVWLYYLWTHEYVRSIWVMPKSLLKKNKIELHRFTHFEDADVVIVDGPKAADALAADAKVFLMGPDRFKKVWRDLKKRLPDVQALAADEVHMYWSTHSSARTQDLYQAGRRFPYFVGMTGTLIDGRLTSAYPMISVIEPRYYLTYGGFLKEHTVQDMLGGVIWQNTDKIVRIIGRHAIKRSFESIYGKENKVLQTEVCDMEEKQREAYNEFERNAVLDLEPYGGRHRDGTVLSTTEAAVAAMRCRQIMAAPELFGILKPGALTGKDELLRLHLENHKASGKPLVVFGCFRAEIERDARLVESMGLTVGTLHGETPTKARVTLDEGFRAGRVQVLVGSAAVAGIGFNWEHCDHIVFTSLDYRDSSVMQGIRRCIRGVRSTPLLVTFLEYEKSLDQRIMKIVRFKSKLAARIDPTREVYSLSQASSRPKEKTL